jgi:hypothetical protein
MEKILQIGCCPTVAITHEKVTRICSQTEGIIIELKEVAVH